MDFPPFQSAKGGIYEECYSEKTNYCKDTFSSVVCSLHFTGCNIYFDIFLEQVYFFVMVNVKQKSEFCIEMHSIVNSH